MHVARLGDSGDHVAPLSPDWIRLAAPPWPSLSQKVWSKGESKQLFLVRYIMEDITFGITYSYEFFEFSKL